MLVIRLQRTGRKGHAQFRVVVQDSRRTPTSGKVVAWLGSYDPHTKNISLNKEKAEQYLSHGAQPTPRVVSILKAEKVKLPKWVTLPGKVEAQIKHPEKLRRNRPIEPTEGTNEVAVESESNEVADSEAISESAEAESTDADTEKETAVETDTATNEVSQDQA